MTPQHFVFKKIDDMLVRFSRLFGTSVHSPTYQHSALILSFGFIHIVTFYTTSWLGWILLWIGFLGVIGVGRAWVANEKQRTAIARKLSDADPDELPDLRISALLSALQLFIIIPLLLRSSHAIFNLYHVPDNATLADWALLGVDLLFRSILDWSEIYGVQMSSIELDSMGGRHLVMAFLLTIDFILIQGIVRIFEIRRTISEGVAAAVRDPEMAYRLGSRAVPSLLMMLEEEKVHGDDCKHVIQALAVLREQKACGAIIKRFENEEERMTAIAAMVAIGHMPPLIDALSSPQLQTRMGSITALRRLAKTDSIPSLVATMKHADVEERESITRALSAIGVDAYPHLFIALSDPSKLVQLAALQGLTLDKSEKLMHKLIAMSSSGDADVRLAVIDAMQRFSDGRVVAPLAAALDDVDPRVAKQAQRSLDYLGSVVASKGTSSDQ